MLVNLLAKRNFFIQFFIISLFFLLGATNFNTIDFTKHEILGIGLTILTIVYVLIIDTKNDLVSKSSYSTWFYMLCLMPCIVQLTDYKLAGSLLLITHVSAELMYFESEKTSKFEAFDIGLFLSFAILLNPPLIILGLVIFGYFLTLKAIDSSILILALLGFLVPILLFVQVSYLLDFYFLVDFYREALLLDFIKFDVKQIFLIPVVILAIITSINYMLTINKESVELKRVLFLLNVMGICFIVISALFGGKDVTYLSFFAFIFMFIFTKYLNNKKAHLNWIKETILWGYLICMLMYNFYDRIPRIFSLITEVRF